MSKLPNNTPLPEPGGWCCDECSDVHHDCDLYWVHEWQGWACLECIEAAQGRDATQGVQLSKFLDGRTLRRV